MDNVRIRALAMLVGNVVNGKTLKSLLSDLNLKGKLDLGNVDINDDSEYCITALKASGNDRSIVELV